MTTFRCEVEIPEELRLVSLHWKLDGTCTAFVKPNDAFYISCPYGFFDGDNAEDAIAGAILACYISMENFADERLRLAERVGPSNGLTRHGPAKLSDMF